jgi:O-antigen ligase
MSFNNNAKTRIIDLTIKQVSDTYLSFLPYSDHHEEHYVSGLKMFIDKPLSGVGTNLFRYYCDRDKYRYKERSCNTHPHHYYIQLLAEQGVFGFIIISTFFLYLSSLILKQFFHLLKSNSKQKIPFNFLLYPVILFIYWWPLIPHMSIYNNWNNVLMMLPLGFFMKYFYGNSNGNFYKT